MEFWIPLLLPPVFFAAKAAPTGATDVVKKRGDLFFNHGQTYTINNHLPLQSSSLHTGKFQPKTDKDNAGNSVE